MDQSEEINEALRKIRQGVEIVLCGYGQLAKIIVEPESKSPFDPDHPWAFMIHL